MRGNRVVQAPLNLRPGSIPACAGEPAAAAGSGPGATVYPRVCGGTWRQKSSCGPDCGLSPRVRGNPPLHLHAEQPAGSIPACAGEPSPSRRSSAARRVYPRVCGGTLSMSAEEYGSRGLSPRVRGNPGYISPSTSSIGSIPACAGEPSGRIYSMQRMPVYPRVCGGTASLLADHRRC